MTDLKHWLPADDLALITPDEQRWLTGIFKRFSVYPSLENRCGLTDWVPAQSPRRVMDYGCGFGRLARIMEPKSKLNNYGLCRVICSVLLQND